MLNRANLEFEDCPALVITIEALINGGFQEFINLFSLLKVPTIN